MTVSHIYILMLVPPAEVIVRLCNASVRYRETIGATVA